MITGFLILAVTVLLLGADAYLPTVGQPTESAWLRDTAWKWSTIPFVIGLLAGHWFFSRFVVDYSAWGYALGFLIAYLASDVVWRLTRPTSFPWWKYPGLHVVAGIPVGMFLWGQSYEWSPV